jgi:hypothetical protein
MMKLARLSISLPSVALAVSLVASLGACASADRAPRGTTTPAAFWGYSAEAVAQPSGPAFWGYSAAVAQPSGPAFWGYTAAAVAQRQGPTFWGYSGAPSQSPTAALVVPPSSEQPPIAAKR